MINVIMYQYDGFMVKNESTGRYLRKNPDWRLCWNHERKYAYVWVGWTSNLKKAIVFRTKETAIIARDQALKNSKQKHKHVVIFPVTVTTHR